MSTCIRRHYSTWTSCTCDDCRILTRKAKKRVRTGRYRPDAARDQAWEALDRMIGEGWTPLAMASATGLPKTYFDSLTTKLRERGVRQKIGQQHAHAILNAGAPTEGTIGTLGSTRRVQALAAIGWSLRDLSDHSGLPRVTIQVIRLAQTATIKPATANAIAATFDELCMSPGSSERTRQRALEAGWAPPLAWDDIDDPAATPDTGPTRGPGRPGLNIEDIEWVIGGGTTNLDALATRLNSTPAAISKALYRAGRIDLVRRLGAVVAA